jgi:hypothetical protein
MFFDVTIVHEDGAEGHMLACVSLDGGSGGAAAGAGGIAAGDFGAAVAWGRFGVDAGALVWAGAFGAAFGAAVSRGDVGWTAVSEPEGATAARSAVVKFG